MAVHTIEDRLARLAAVLGDARRASNLTIADVESQTMIRASYLEALEASRFNELPAPVYARRILQTLASFFDLDAADILALYDVEYASHLETERRFESLGDSHSNGRSNGRNGLTRPESDAPIHAYRLAGIGAAVLAVLALGGYVVSQLESFSAPPRLVLEEPGGDVRVDHRTIMVRGQADVGSSVSINNLAVLTNEVGAFHVPYELSPGQNVITVLAQKKNGKSTRISHTVSADFSDPLPSQPDHGFLAVVSANETTWVQIHLDGNVAYEGVIVPDAGRTFSGTTDLQIHTQNAGVTRVAINGQDQGPLGRSGQRGTFSYSGASAVGMASLPPVPRTSR